MANRDVPTDIIADARISISKYTDSVKLSVWCTRCNSEFRSTAGFTKSRCKCRRVDNSGIVMALDWYTEGR